MARTTVFFARFVAMAVMAAALPACASIEAHPRYATRIEDVLPSERATRDRPPERPPVYREDDAPRDLPPRPSDRVETEELPPLAQNDTRPPRRDAPPPRREDPPARWESERESRPTQQPEARYDGERQYVVQPGDTLSGIARRFSTPVQTLIELNGLTPQGAVRSGQAVTLPASATDKGVDPYASGPAPRAVRSGPGVGLEGQRTASRPTTTQATTPRPVVAAETPTPRPTAVTPQPSVPTGTVAQRGRGKFIWPVRGDVIARYGSAGTGLRNDGINIAAPAGTTVKASAGGDVVYAGSAVPGFGNLVLIKHADGWVTAYGHLETINVRMRDRVAQGSPVGTVGQSGGAPQPQLHFEIRYAPNPTVKAAPVDPSPILP